MISINNGVYTTVIAKNRVNGNREKNDFYATAPEATEKLLKVQEFSKNIWECACGAGHISKVLQSGGYDVKSTDLIYRGYGETESYDFLKNNNIEYAAGKDIITNPPYKYATEFVEKSLDSIQEGHKVAMFLKLTFLEGQKRKLLFKKYPPRYVYVFSKRVNCAMNGEFEKYGNNAVAYAWFIWIKGYNGEPVIRWI